MPKKITDKKKKSTPPRGRGKKITVPAVIAGIAGLVLMGLGGYSAVAQGKYDALYISALGACFLVALYLSYRK